MSTASVGVGDSYVDFAAVDLYKAPIGTLCRLATVPLEAASDSEPSAVIFLNFPNLLCNSFAVAFDSSTVVRA